MAKIDPTLPRWRAIRAMFETGVRLRWIADATNLTPKFVRAEALRRGWSVHDPGRPATPADMKARLMSAVSRRLSDLAVDDGDDEEKMARSVTALARTTDAAGRLAVALAAGAGRDDDERDDRSDDDVRRSIRRKLQAWLGRAREPGRE